jgi:hypothetical protein
MPRQTNPATESRMRHDQARRIKQRTKSKKEAERRQTQTKLRHATRVKYCAEPIGPYQRIIA